MANADTDAVGAAAPAAPVPCLALDHVSLTVPDLEQAVRFFVEVFGARDRYRRAHPGGPDMAAQLNAHPHARFRLAKLELAGMGLELFEYSAPDLCARMPRNCDAGGGHLGLLVEDVAACAERLRGVPGVTVLGQPRRLEAGHPLAGRWWIYFLTPWGYQMELVSRPLPRP